MDKSKEKNKDRNGFLILPCILDLLGSNIYNNVYELILNDIKNPLDMSEVLSEYLSHYISRGGYSGYKNDMNIENTSNIFLLLSLIKIYINYDKNDDIPLLKIKKGLKETLKNVLSDKGYQIKIRSFANNISTEDIIDNINYDENFYGNENKNMRSDICVRVMFLGIYYKDNLDKMINNCIIITKLTHNNTISILSAISSAYIVYLASNNIDIEKWGFEVFDLVNSDNVKKHLNLDKSENMIGYVSFMKLWNNFLDSRFSQKKIKKTLSDNNLIYKMKFYQNFNFDASEYIIGEDCINCLIVSYDSLLNCGGNFEKLIYYSILIPGQVVSVGGFVGGLYSLVFGMENIPQYMIDFLDQETIQNLRRLESGL
jgi:ADP-ribosylglycohydrolase